MAEDHLVNAYRLLFNSNTMFRVTDPRTGSRKHSVELRNDNVMRSNGVSAFQIMHAMRAEIDRRDLSGVSERVLEGIDRCRQIDRELMRDDPDAYMVPLSRLVQNIELVEAVCRMNDDEHYRMQDPDDVDRDDYMPF
jgi:hypothetical protein